MARLAETRRMRAHSVTKERGRSAEGLLAFHNTQRWFHQLCHWRSRRSAVLGTSGVAAVNGAIQEMALTLAKELAGNLP